MPTCHAICTEPKIKWTIICIQTISQMIFDTEDDDNDRKKRNIIAKNSIYAIADSSQRYGWLSFIILIAVVLLLFAVSCSSIACVLSFHFLTFTCLRQFTFERVRAQSLKSIERNLLFVAAVTNRVTSRSILHGTSRARIRAIMYS